MQSGLLKPGDYAQVSMGLPGAAAMLRLPASALMFRAAGLQVATWDATNRIVMKPITIGTDLGTWSSSPRAQPPGPGGEQSAGFPGRWRQGTGSRQCGLNH